MGTRDGGNVLKLDRGDGCTNLVSAYFHLGTESDRCSISTHASKITTAMGRGLCLCLLKIFLGSGNCFPKEKFLMCW